MKGYKNNLKEFIDYIFRAYGNDDAVAKFRDVYEKREQARVKEAERRAKTDRKSITISMDTADLCKAMINGELTKFRELQIINDYTERLENACLELTDGYIESISKVLRRINEFDYTR